MKTDTFFWTITGIFAFAVGLLYLISFMVEKHESVKQFELPKTYQTVSD